jgi:hypothetical protein
MLRNDKLTAMRRFGRSAALLSAAGGPREAPAWLESLRSSRAGGSLHRSFASPAFLDGSHRRAG